MGNYLGQIDALPVAEQWPLIRSWIFDRRIDFLIELLTERPVLTLPELTLAVGHGDCVTILLRHDLFGNDLYVAKQGAYWMSQDDTAQHWREKSIMRAILDREDIPAIRDWVAKETARRLDEADDTIDAVTALTRGVPLAMVQHWFGFDGAQATDMQRWSYWSQMDAFWSQPFDAPGFATPDAIAIRREAGTDEMRAYLVGLVQRRAADLRSGTAGSDVVTRLLRLSMSGALRFDPAAVVLNVGGLLVGAVETTSHAVVNAVEYLVAHPELHAVARAAAQNDDTALLDGMVFEALRFRPAFPYFFRVARSETVIGQASRHSVRVKKGSTVLALTHGAMFDPRVTDQPGLFDPTRALGQSFTFGLGIHECLGRAISAVTIPAIAGEILKRDGLAAGIVDRRGGPVPESWDLRLH